jgi:hypothetical protein
MKRRPWLRHLGVAAVSAVALIGFALAFPTAASASTGYTIAQQGPTTVEVGAFAQASFAVTGPSCQASTTSPVRVNILPENLASFNGAYSLSMTFTACDVFQTPNLLLGAPGPWTFDLIDTFQAGSPVVGTVTLNGVYTPNPLTVQDLGTGTIQPGQTETINYTLGSGNLCHVSSTFLATVTLHPSAGVTVTPATFTETACGADQHVDVTSNVPGTYQVSATMSTIYWPNGAFDTSQAGFTLTVSPSVSSDNTPPTLPNLPNLSVTATSAAGAVVSYGPATATDAVDGTDPVVFTPPSGSTFALGTHTVSYTATDAAGNTATAKSFTVTVKVPWNGILQPVNADGSSVFKLGSTVPLKFAGFSGLTATLTVTKSDSTPDGTDAEAVNSNPADSGNVFRYDATAGLYLYNLGTKNNMSVGDWYAHINLGDQVDHVVRFSLRR